jgi:two-component system, chemotaxis family, chemotaxis protein CheY
MGATQAGRILIVDDAADIVLLLEQFLQGEGYLVTKASNGLEALLYLQSSQELPNLILLDLMMPEMDGYEFRMAQENDPRFAKIPVVVMTADANIQSNTTKIGAQAFLKKPFKDLDTISDIVRNFISK